MSALTSTLQDKAEMAGEIKLLDSTASSSDPHGTTEVELAFIAGELCIYWLHV